MSVTINTSNSTPIKQALSNNLAVSAMAATKMATGEQYINLYEDPTSNAIGLNMQSDLSVLRTVLKGITQSQSLLYIAESGGKSIYYTVNKMKEILGQAKLGYMTDDLIKNTLAPTYMQLKQEINRIADSVSFNGQTLLNGKGGRQNAGIAASVATTPNYQSTNNSAVSIAPYAASTSIATGLSASTITGGKAGAVTFKSGSSLVTPQVTGGEISTDSAGNIIVTGATLIFNGITVSDSETPAKTGTGNLTVHDVNLQFASGKFTFADGTISSQATAAPTITNKLTATNFSFTSTGGEITSVSGFTGTPTLAAIPNSAGSSISNISQTYDLTGGIDAGSGFSFVTGTDLNFDIIEFKIPNMRLNTSANVLGMINTINTDKNVLSVAPTDLTTLQSTEDADTDIPLIEALLKNIIAQLDQLGAYETRMKNIETQLQNSVEQLDSAQGVFMNADLAEQTEVFTKSNVKVNVAISCLKNLNESLKALQNLVS